MKIISDQEATKEIEELTQMRECMKKEKKQINLTEATHKTLKVLKKNLLLISDGDGGESGKSTIINKHKHISLLIDILAEFNL